MNEILDAILEAKSGAGTRQIGSARRNARGRGEDNGGVQGCQNCRSDEDQAFGTLGLHLARRPWWGGGPLRAFRRAVLCGRMALWFCWFVSLLGCAALEVMWVTLYEVWVWLMR